MSILITNVLHNNEIVDVYIEDNCFSKIGSNLSMSADMVIDGSDKAILPAFYNTHTHAAMSILRGYGDDKPLFEWLQEDIWPIEDKLTAEDIYIASCLAILEMIKSGTVFFADMYFEGCQTINAVEKMGIRAAISIVNMDLFDEKMTAHKKQATVDFFAAANPCVERVIKCISCHAVYTVSDELFLYAANMAKNNGYYMQIHACETKQEVDDCVEKWGMSPIEKLDSLGILNDKTILAHAVHLSDKDIEIIQKRGCVLSTNPVSNLKLNSGNFMFEKLYSKMPNKISLGTDGAASNNNLSMIESMKICSLSAKLQAGSALAGKACEVFKAATQNGAAAFGLNAGVVKEGALADCILVDLNNYFMTPTYNIISNMAYSADSSCIWGVICDGKPVMLDRKVEDEEIIISNAKILAEKICSMS